MMGSRNLNRYLKYAVGEIILVVLGILIALQINNWNEQRKQHREEIKMLQNFRNSIRQDLDGINWNINAFNYSDRSIGFILDYFQQELPYMDSLPYHFASTTQLWAPRINMAVFETATSTDLNIITNDELKKQIIAYYSFARGNFTILIERYTNIIEDASRRIFPTRFDGMWNGSWDSNPFIMIPVDYNSLKQDQEYLYFLRTLKNQLFWYIRNPLNDAKRDGEALLQAIDQELLKHGET